MQGEPRTDSSTENLSFSVTPMPFRARTFRCCRMEHHGQAEHRRLASLGKMAHVFDLILEIIGFVKAEQPRKLGLGALPTHHSPHVGLGVRA